MIKLLKVQSLSSYVYSPSIFFTLLLILIILISDSNLLKLNDIIVPEMVEARSAILLHCDYDLEKDKLYSVKWYKNNQEFYRYLISSNQTKPEHKFFPQIGVYMDLHHSTVTHVHLYTSDLNTEGSYGCEVSTETPFKTVKAEKDLKIYVLPKAKLRLTSKWINRGKDFVNITCLSGPSKPPSLLSWTIKSSKNQRDNLKVHTSPLVVKRNKEGLWTSFISLLIHFEPKVEVKLRCTSLICHPYLITFSELIMEEAGQLRLESYSDGRVSPPQIIGHEFNYTIGDMLAVNCSADLVYPPPYLQWFINGKKASLNETTIYAKENDSNQDFQQFSSVYDNYFFTANQQPLSIIVALKTELTKQHFWSEGLVKLRCIATYSKIIFEDKEEIKLSKNGRYSSFFSSYHSTSIKLSNNLVWNVATYIQFLLLLFSSLITLI